MKYWLAMGLLVFSCGLASAQVACVAGATGKLRMTPSETSPVVLEVPTHYPLAVAAEKDGYYQVSDYRGRTGWIRKEAVAAGRCTVAIRDRINVRGGPGTGHEPVLSAREGVAFQVLQASDEWVQVRHESGRTGWIHRPLLWGVR